MAFRPKTLTAAIVPIIATTALVYTTQQPVQWWISVYALLASIFIQIGTNLVNDAVDFKKGADNEKRIGPQRVTQSGIFSAKEVMIVGTIFFILAILFGIPLVLKGGWPIVIIGLVSVLFGYAYTAGPFPLAYLGLGDIFVVFFFGLVAVGGLYFLQLEDFSSGALVLGLQIGLHCAVLIAINNLRDVDGDVLVHKKTLPVRFGKKFARFEIAALCFIPFLLQLFWLQNGFVLAALLPFISLPLAIRIVKLVFFNEPGPAYNNYLAQAAGLHLFFGVLISVGLVLRG